MRVKLLYTLEAAFRHGYILYITIMFPEPTRHQTLVCQLSLIVTAKNWFHFHLYNRL